MSKKSTHIWQSLRAYPVGKRFESYFNQRKALRSSILRRCLAIAAGVFLIISGFIFLPTPVPGILLLFLGASLLAQESLVVARVLDWAEVRVRAYTSIGSIFWRKAHITLKVLITLSLICLLGLVGLRAYLLIFSI